MGRKLQESISNGVLHTEVKPINPRICGRKNPGNPLAENPMILLIGSDGW